MIVIAPRPSVMEWRCCPTHRNDEPKEKPDLHVCWGGGAVAPTIQTDPPYITVLGGHNDIIK
jgi:hypothetical protein